jgi:hypothetical protein
MDKKLANAWWNASGPMSGLTYADLRDAIAKLDIDALNREQEHTMDVMYWDGMDRGWRGLTVYENLPFGGIRTDGRFRRLAGEVEAIICAKWGWHI